MPTKTKTNNNNSSKSISVYKPVSNPIASRSPYTSSHPTYQPQSMMENIKAGFGLGVGTSIGARITDSIFGNRTFNVVNKIEEQTQSSVSTSTNSHVDKCHYIIDEIQFNKCDNNVNNDKCNKLFEKFYSCHKNM